MLTMLEQRGTRWNEQPPFFKDGHLILREPVPLERDIRQVVADAMRKYLTVPEAV